MKKNTSPLHLNHNISAASTTTGNAEKLDIVVCTKPPRWQSKYSRRHKQLKQEVEDLEGILKKLLYHSKYSLQHPLRTLSIQSQVEVNRLRQENQQLKQQYLVYIRYMHHVQQLLDTIDGEEKQQETVVPF